MIALGDKLAVKSVRGRDCMIRMAACMAAGAIFALSALRATAAPDTPPADMARVLIQGCLADPSVAATAQLATTVRAEPYSDAKNKSVLARRGSTTVPDERVPGATDRTDTEVVAYQGWALPGSSAGGLAYIEQLVRKVTIEQATGRPVDALRLTRSRACVIETKTLSGRAVFEAYESLHDGNYGALITADRKDIVVFRFNPDAYDIELDIGLDAPLAGTRPGVERNGPGRLVLLDGGSRFINSVTPGVQTVTLTRADLLVGLDRPATIGFANTVLESASSPTPASPPAAAPKPAAGP